jgi:hypothetical protein
MRGLRVATLAAALAVGAVLGGLTASAGGSVLGGVKASVGSARGVPTASAGATTEATLERPDAPVVIQQTQPASNGSATGPINVHLPDELLGIEPGDLVAFSWDGGWEQIPVQVDEREVIDLNRIYGPGYPNCSDPCYSKPPDGARHINYTDPETWVGPDSDPTLDADDEVALMARDAGAPADSPFAPAGVNPETGTEVEITDPLDGATGYVYLFERSDPDLDPGAGASYVEYDFELLNGPYKEGAYHPTNTAPGQGMARGPRPERSEVRTANYTRGFTDRWLDDEIRIHRGEATGVDILDRHDAQFDALDATCIRTQTTYRAGEGAFVTNKSGPVRAIRDFIGANSGPHVQRQHVFYDGKEDINTFLRVHPVPGVTDFFDYSADGIGLRYSNGVGDLTINSELLIDGVPDPFLPAVGLSGLDGWEKVDGPQGGLTMPQRFVTNNVDPTFRVNYRDGNVTGMSPCNGDDELYGASGPQGNTIFENTDEAGRNQWGGGLFKYLYYQRTIYFEAPGEADGPRRSAEEQNPLQLAIGPAGLVAEPENEPPVAGFELSPSSPTAGELVTFTSTSTDPDGEIVAYEWDLTGDGEFDDASGEVATRRFGVGERQVSLRVTDDAGATDVATRLVTVCRKQGC